MKSKKTLMIANNLATAVESETEEKESDNIAQDYQELNEKCDTVISKIKSRKEKSKRKNG